MPGKAQDDELVMSLVDLTLARPPEERGAYLQSACAGDPDLYREVWRYVEWETRMKGFLLAPFYSPATAEHPFETGELLDQRFRIVREVAQGGMGVVYEAVDEKLGRNIALKCAKAGFGNRLPPEVRLATEISHPNVCKIFEIHTASTPLGEIDFVTMEFLAGETLAERLAHGALPEAEAATIARQLCAGLAEAHRNHVIHGDLKSNNVILSVDADGGIRAVITDFGLARGMEASLAGHAGASGGTPDYMAPELWQGGKPSIASDLYALGVILYELAYGRRPQAKEKLIATKPKWDRVITRCLEADPVLRFHDAGEVAETLAPKRKFRWWLAAGAAAALATAAAIITYQSATAPSRKLRISQAPFTAPADAASMAANISGAAAAELKQLKGGKVARLSILQSGEKGATHVVEGTIAQDNGIVVLHVWLTDTHSQAHIEDREFRYAAADVRYAPTAVAGMVTYALGLPPLAVVPVNEAAKQHYLKGLEYTRRNSTVDQALPLLERAVAEDRDSPLTWAALGEGQWFKYFVTRDKGWLDRTAESLQQAQDRNLDVAAVHVVAGLLQSYEHAEAEYRRAIDLEPRNADAHRRLAQTYDRRGDSQKALVEYRKAVELAPGYFKNYQGLGDHFASGGDPGEAARQLEKCVQLAPDESDPHYALGTVYADLRRFDDAERELRKAIELGPTAKAFNNLATVLMSQGKDAESIPVLQQAIQGSPGDYLWWMNLGDCYRRTKQEAASMGAYRRSLGMAEKELAASPRDGLLRSRVSYLCARLKQPERAESEVAQALGVATPSSDTLEAAVWTYEALGEREKSLEILRSSHVKVDVGQRSDVAGLRQDSRFQQLVALGKAK